MSVYTDAEKKVYAEAVRCVPGLVAAKERKSPEDARSLFDGYMTMCKEQGVQGEKAWSILFNASVHWVHQLAQARAAGFKDDRTTLDVIFGMGAVASGWTP